MRLPSAGQCTRACAAHAHPHAHPHALTRAHRDAVGALPHCSCSALVVVHAPNLEKRATTLSDANAQMRPRKSYRLFWFIQCCFSSRFGPYVTAEGIAAALVLSCGRVACDSVLCCAWESAGTTPTLATQLSTRLITPRASS